MNIYQVNLQSQLGGGEIFTAFLTRAFDRLGIPTTLFVSRDAEFWTGLNLPISTRLVPVSESICDAVPSHRGWVIDHSGLGKAVIDELLQRQHYVTSIAHMPSQGRRDNAYGNYAYVFGVSGYVIQGLQERGIPVWEEPLYGIADLSRGASDEPVVQASRYDWDQRKGRDRLLSWIAPFVGPLLSRQVFDKRPGITLGIVSRITPIKQFPQLFNLLSPILAEYPQFNLELFGSGGYASVRDLRRALAPISTRVRWWGQQTNIRAIYGQIDYLLTGLPEKEALGLNVIEAQMMGVPVLSVDGGPFVETVAQNLTGIRYADPRMDGGTDFRCLLERLISQPFGFDLSDTEVQAHLKKFSASAFDARLTRIVEHMKNMLD